ncbi:MAG: bifunctional hydroxymethylpyrimidine kinase/phosphomethylpyrimidine kinase [Kiritimatiellae bacterium]|nr:bifunctional hydroxymethylpyrimidine kinase/phosphomethylpyrimidine kinase [Kiritimatiellia bacterium]
MRPVVWTIAGTDPAGAAGVFADLFVLADFEVQGCAVISAVVAQNSKAVSRIQRISPAVLRAQMASLEEDYPPQAVKIGMLGSASSVRAVAHFLKTARMFSVCDPVMISSSGGELLDGPGRSALKKHLLPLLDLLTPNIPEAEMLTGHPVDDFPSAAAEILALGAKSVLIKGGHASEEESRDYWTDGKDSAWFAAPRIAGREFRGTGCALSSAIAAAVARGRPLKTAVAEAKQYVTEAMKRSEVCVQGKWILATGSSGPYCGRSRMPDSSLAS